MELFTAQVQYGDWKGHVAADNTDHEDVHQYLRENRLINDGEFVVGLQMYSGDRDFFICSALVVEFEGFENVRTMLEATPDPIKMRKIDLEIPLVDFFKLFKRLDLKFAARGLPIIGRTINSEE